MLNNSARTPQPVNEPILEYREGSVEREKLTAELDRQYNNRLEIPVIIDGKAMGITIIFCFE